MAYSYSGGLDFLHEDPAVFAQLKRLAQEFKALPTDRDKSLRLLELAKDYASQQDRHQAPDSHKVRRGPAIHEGRGD